MFGRLVVTQNANIKSMHTKKKTDIELLEDLELENEKKRRHHYQEAELQEEERENPKPIRERIIASIVGNARELVYGKYEEYFYFFVMSSCILSGITAGVGTYNISTEVNQIIDNINILVLSVFVLEIVLKFIAAGSQPLDYFRDPVHGKWNTFDFIVTVISFPGVAGEATAMVRILRLFRIVEQFQKINAMKAIVIGLLAGMKSIGYILLLLFLVFYMYAVVGVSSFGNNNPFVFGNIAVALIALFRGMTLENWESMLFVDAFGCDVFNADIYVNPWEFLSVNETQTESNKWQDVSRKFRCEHPNKRSMLATAYWVSFVVVSAFVVLALFIGVITLHMQDSINTVRLEKEEVSTVVLL